MRPPVLATSIPLQQLRCNLHQFLQYHKSNVRHTLKRTIIENDDEPTATAWGATEKVEEESKSWLDEPPGHLEFENNAM